MPLELVIHLVIGGVSWFVASRFLSNKTINVLFAVIVGQLIYAVIHYPIAVDTARNLQLRLTLAHYLALLPIRIATSFVSAFILFKLGIITAKSFNTATTNFHEAKNDGKQQHYYNQVAANTAPADTLMQYGITKCNDGRYQYKEFRYDKYEDAENYAKLDAKRINKFSKGSGSNEKPYNQNHQQDDKEQKIIDNHKVADSEYIQNHVNEVHEWLKENVTVFGQVRNIIMRDFKMDWERLSGSFKLTIDGTPYDWSFDFSCLTQTGKPKVYLPMFCSPLGAPASYAAVKLPDIVVERMELILSKILPSIKPLGLDKRTGVQITYLDPHHKRLPPESEIQASKDILSQPDFSVTITL